VVRKLLGLLLVELLEGLVEFVLFLLAVLAGAGGRLSDAVSQ
jgi:hypothetical protein